MDRAKSVADLFQAVAEAGVPRDRYAPIAGISGRSISRASRVCWRFACSKHGAAAAERRFSLTAGTELKYPRVMRLESPSGIPIWPPEQAI